MIESSVSDILKRYPDIPEIIVTRLCKYAEDGFPLGDFLQAVIANDFRDVVCRADAFNELCFRQISQLVYSELPGDCHGSRRIYKLWMFKHSASRKDLMHDLTKIRIQLKQAVAEAHNFHRR